MPKVTLFFGLASGWSISLKKVIDMLVPARVCIYVCVCYMFATQKQNCCRGDFIYMYIYIYIYTHTHIYTSIYIYIYIYMIGDTCI
jgi:hypothetical protein